MGPMVLGAGNGLNRSHLCQRCGLGKGADIDDEDTPGKRLWPSIVEGEPQVPTEQILRSADFAEKSQERMVATYVHMPSHVDMKVREKAKICANPKSLCVGVS